MDLKRFEDYKQEVIRVYKEKKKEGDLPSKLQDSTPANLKNECLDVFHNRYSDKDSETFKNLYGERNNAGEYFQKIKALGADKFKPLDNFLKGITDDTKRRNIELLAWLIDFQPRPHRPGDPYDLGKPQMDQLTNEVEQKKSDFEGSKNVSDDKRANEVIDLSENTETVTDRSEETNDPLKINDENFGVPRKFNKTIVAFFAAFVILSGSYIFYSQKPQCMYWNGTHYQSTACDQKIDGATIIALDNYRLTDLKKITNKALITRNDIGKVHYSKINGIVVFYTTGGENPEDNHRRLLPMTEYMYEKYVLNKN